MSIDMEWRKCYNGIKAKGRFRTYRKIENMKYYNVYSTPASVSTDGKLAGVDLFFEQPNGDMKFSIACSRETLVQIYEVIKERLAEEWV